MRKLSIKIDDFGNFFIANKIKALSDILDIKFILPNFDKGELKTNIRLYVIDANKVVGYTKALRISFFKKALKDYLKDKKLFEFLNL